MAWKARLCSLPIQPTLISPTPISVMPLSLTCPTMTFSLSTDGWFARECFAAEWRRSAAGIHRGMECDCLLGSAGGAECGLGCRGQQGGVGTDGDKGPALLNPLGGGRTVGDEQP